MSKTKFLMPLLVLAMAVGVGTSVVACTPASESGPVEPAQKTLTGIEIATPPTKVEYADGDDFDPTGMVVNALYDDNSKEAVTDYTYSPKKLKFGDTQVTVTYKRMKATVNVTVKEVPITGMELDVSNVELHKNETKTIKVTISPENASNKEATFSTSDANVATVSASGEIRGVKVGTAVITVTSSGKNASGQAITKTVNVSVVATELSSLTIAQPTVTLNITDEEAHPTAQVEYDILPANADEKGATFESSDTDVVTVSDTGLLTVEAVGTATITVTSIGVDAQGNHLTGEVAVTVTSEVYVIEFRNADGSLLEGIKAEDIEIDDVPDYNGASPKKGADDNYAYTFRGFDKPFAAYDGTKQVYTAVFEGVTLTIEKAYLTVENAGTAEQKIYVVYEGHTKGYTTESLKGTVAFQFWRLNQWNEWKRCTDDPEISADGSWTAVNDISDLAEGNTQYYTRINWGDLKNVEPKPLYKETKLRYRHDAQTGTIYEDANQGDNWDGVFPEGYAPSDLRGFPEDMSDEDKIAAYKAAVPITWVGYDIEYTEDAVITTGHMGTKFSIPGYGLLCFSGISDQRDLKVTMNTAELVKENDKVIFRAHGTKSGFGENEFKCWWDVQENSYYMYKGWSPSHWGTVAAISQADAPFINDNEFVLDIVLSDLEFTKYDDCDFMAFSFHIWNTLNNSGNGDTNPWTDLGEGAVLEDANYSYELIKDATYTWNNLGLKVTPKAAE